MPFCSSSDDTDGILHAHAHVTLYVQGIGTKVLKRSGWKEGSGVGASKQGITEPVDTEGQHPLNKRGLGLAALSSVPTYNIS